MAAAPPLAILGYGRFGRAVTELARAAGHAVRVFDPAVDVPPALAAGSIGDAVVADALIVPAVPMEQFAAVCTALRPHCTPDHCVIDVTSVKRPAVTTCAAVFGDAIPWVATHPLFGPASLARGEHPLRVVVCPDTPHAGAVARATAWFTGLGCRVISQDHDAHDRLMAETHALAFFVAKGLLELRAGADAEAVPPSFAAMATTIATVRSDAGHLFFPIQHHNPHAAEARARLLAALERIHRDLAAAAATPGTGAPPAALAMPVAPPPAALLDTRAQIDALDAQIVALLGRRAALARRAAGVKAADGRAVQDPARERALLDARRLAAQAADLDPGGVADVFEAVLRLSRAEQARWLASHGAASEDPAPA